MKRFLRYLLLVFSVLILAIWSWSFSHTSEIQRSKKSDTWAIGVNWGLIHFRHQTDSKYNGVGFFWSSGRNRVYTSYINRLGLRFPFSYHSIRTVPSGDDDTPMRVHTADNFYLPIWSVSLLSILVTSLLWYHPLKAKLRGTDRAGFEVEVKERGQGLGDRGQGQEKA